MPNPGLRQQPRGILGGVTVQTSDCHADLKVHRDIHELSFETGETTTLTVEVKESYWNMKEFLVADPRILEAADEATRRIGLEPTRTAIRGGTDGAVLSARGLLTPNIFTGGQEYHSVREWISVQDMAASAAAVVELVKLWAEPDWAERK